MDDQKQITEQEFVINQQLESLARQNAQQAVRISQLESQIALMQAKAQQSEQAPQMGEDSDEIEPEEDFTVDTIN